MITKRGNPEWRRFASLHENMHSYIGSVNEIFNQVAMPTPSFLDNMPVGFNPILYKVLDEGLAQWGAVEASAIAKGSRTFEQREEAHEHFVGSATYPYFYREGYNFIRVLMERFQVAGLDTSSALALVTKNLPSNFEQIEKPDDYFKILAAKTKDL